MASKHENTDKIDIELSMLDKGNIEYTVRELIEYFYVSYKSKFSWEYPEKNFKNDYKIFEDLIIWGWASADLKSKIDKYFSSVIEIINERSYTTGSFKAALRLLEDIPVKESEKIHRKRVARVMKEKLDSGIIGA